MSRLRRLPGDLLVSVGNMLAEVALVCYGLAGVAIALWRFGRAWVLRLARGRSSR